MFTNNQIPRCTPEEQGVSSVAISGFLEAAEAAQLELHSLMILRHAHVIAQGWWPPYRPEDVRLLFSATKTFTSTAVGFAVSEGYITLEDKVISFFPEYAPEAVHRHLEAMTIRHLLTMSPGHSKPSFGIDYRRNKGSWVRHFLQELEIDHPPGSRFVYSGGPSHMLSAIVQKVTGQTLLQYLQPRLFEPLGIVGARWETDPAGICSGGFGLSIKTEDFARFGQLLLQRGLWNGCRILPEQWIHDATSFQIDNSQHGYGYQFSLSLHGSYSSNGAHGQLCLVIPEQDMVITLTAGDNRMNEVVGLIWEHLYPAASEMALPQAEACQQGLSRQLSPVGYSCTGQSAQSAAARMQYVKRYEIMDPLESVKVVAFDFKDDSCIFTLWDHRGEHSIHCGFGMLRYGMTTMTGNVLHHEYQPDVIQVAASGVWRNEHTFEMVWHFIETPFRDTIVCTFEGEKLTLHRSVNVNNGPLELPALQGELAPYTRMHE